MNHVTNLLSSAEIDIFSPEINFDDVRKIGYSRPS